MAASVTGKRHPLIVAGDVGATKTSLGLFAVKGDRPALLKMETFSSRAASGLEELVERMLDGRPDSVAAACFGIAGPVHNGCAVTTNLSWRVSESSLKKRFGWKRVRLINDLEATAMAIPYLKGNQFRKINGAAVRFGEPIAVIAPGTGLGQAFLIRHRGEYLPLPSEGGHADFAPTDDLEIDLWRYLKDRFGHASVERILSGAGLLNLYRGLLAVGGFKESAGAREAMARVEPPSVITELALQDADPLCRAVVERFCKILGSVAGNLALNGCATGGVFLGGGIPPKILPFLESGPFMAAFTAKGRFSEFTASIAVRVILDDKAAVMGAAYGAQSLLKLAGFDLG